MKANSVAIRSVFTHLGALCPHSVLITRSYSSPSVPPDSFEAFDQNSIVYGPLNNDGVADELIEVLPDIIGMHTV